MTAPRPRRASPAGATAPEPVRHVEQRSRLAALLAARYGASGVALTPFYEEADKAVYRVDRDGADPWILRLFPAARPLEQVEGDAAVLRYLEEHGVPAERIVRADDGALATRLDGNGLRPQLRFLRHWSGIEGLPACALAAFDTERCRAIPSSQRVVAATRSRPVPPLVPPPAKKRPRPSERADSLW